MIDQLLGLYEDLYTQEVMNGRLRGVHTYEVMLNNVLFEKLASHLTYSNAHAVRTVECRSYITSEYIQYRTAVGTLLFRLEPPMYQYVIRDDINPYYGLSGIDAAAMITNGSRFSFDDEIPF